MTNDEMMTGCSQDSEGVRLKQGKGGPGGRGKLFLEIIHSM